MITCANKISKTLTLKLTADLMILLIAGLTLPEMFNTIFKAFSRILRVSK